ncbi:MAG: hypothetical protein RLZ33_1119, partial [Bacteroidota bacterium]
FEAVSLMKCDYYPFGMEMPGRKITTSNYRFGYNGMEKDDEVSGGGNSYDYGARQYNNRLGRWMSQDPLKAMYPSMSPYCYAGNSPIACYDPNGRLIIFVNGFLGGIYGFFNSSNKSEPLKPYWGKSGYLEEATIYFGNDKNQLFLNGSDGSFGFSTASNRYDKGYKNGICSAEAIKKALLEEELVTGNKATIKMLTHSMGGAYGEGYIAGLIEAGIPADQIEKIVHLSTSDTADITISDKAKDIYRVQLGIDRDFTLFDNKRGADPYTDGKDRMIPGIDLYGEINADGPKMLNYAWEKDSKKRYEYESEYDYHDYTKSKSQTFDALRELENAHFNYSNVNCANNICTNYYHITLKGDYNWNSLKIGSGSYLENTKKDGTGDIYHDGCD